MTHDQKVEEAIKLFGKEAVSFALEMVAISDADGAHTHLEDMGEYDAAEAVQFIYFEE